MSERQPLSLLNVFEVETDGQNRHLICFLDPVLAGSVGIDARSVIGEFDPDEDGEFDRNSFIVNTTFIEALTDYMNERTSWLPSIVEEATRNPSEWLYLLDPRFAHDSDEPAPPEDLVGAFAVDDAGQIVPNSFQYNANHEFFHEDNGPSGVLSDRDFYDWLHGMEGDKPKAEQGTSLSND